MRTLCVTLLAALALAANADTVVRYTFDNLGSIGTALDSLSTITNSANPGTYDARVYQMSGATKNSNQTGASFLYVTNGIPEAFRVFDPMAKKSASAVDGAVRFMSNGGGQGGVMLETATDSSFFTDSFTVEALVRFPSSMSAAAYGVLATQLRDNGSLAWKLRFSYNRELQVVFRNSSGENVELGKASLPSGVNFNDGKWHHVAMRVVQGEASARVRIYFDYKWSATYTTNCRVQFPESAENSVLQIGGTTLAGQLFMGEISEFRYSSTDLSQDKFLRPRSTGNRLDADCVLYYDFEDVTDDWSWFAASFGAVVNKAMPGIMDGTFNAGTIAGKGTLPKIDTDVPFEAMCLSESDDKPQENTRSFYNNYQDTDHRSSDRYLSCAVASGFSLSDSDFTIEMFYKTDGNVLYWTPLFRRSTAPLQQLYLGVGDNVVNNDGHSYFRALLQSVSSDGSVTNSVNMRDTVQTNDGKWHHLALVRNGRSLTFYRDGDSVGSSTLEYDSLLPETTQWWFAGGGGGCNTFNGWIDSVRVTMRALAPEEFLRKKVKPGFMLIVR